MKTLTIFAIGAALTAALAPRAAPAETETVKLVYALPVSLPAVIPYIAVDKGFFRDEGLDVEARMFSSGREALQALLAGQAQIQSVSETPVVHAIIQGNKIVTVATIARHHEAKLIVRNDSGINKPEDLAGKRVATLPGTNSDYFMYKFLAAHGLKPGQVKIANMPPPEMVSAFAKGDIDGYFAWEPHIQFGLAAVPASHVFLPGKLYSGWNTVNMNPDFVKANPETTRRILRALIKSEAFVKTHKDESIRLVAARLKLDEKILRSVWDQNKYQVELDKSLIKDMTEIGRWSLEMSKSDKPLPNFRQFIDDEPLRQVRPKSDSL
jgi:NitT/TauT family transport system substrate-binding protein